MDEWYFYFQYGFGAHVLPFERSMNHVGLLFRLRHWRTAKKLFSNMAVEVVYDGFVSMGGRSCFCFTKICKNPLVIFKFSVKLGDVLLFSRGRH